MSKKEIKIPATPIATIQVDVDPFWFISSLYRESRGSCIEERTIYQEAIPLYLARFKANGIRATFFIVGRDLEDKRNLAVIERILAEGHELANHSLHHCTTLGLLPEHEMRIEIDECAERMERLFGVRPLGFKAPAYGVTPAMLDYLAREGYEYDSSVHPSVAIPLVRAVQRYLLGYGEKSVQFGNWHAAFSSLTPYRPGAVNIYRPGGNGILELPVSTAPFLRTPCHFSFVNVGGMWLFYLAAALWRAAKSYFFNYAFHAVDILDENRVPPLIVQRPGLAKSTSAKMGDIDVILERLATRFNLMTSLDAARVFAS